MLLIKSYGNFDHFNQYSSKMSHDFDYVVVMVEYVYIMDYVVQLVQEVEEKFGNGLW